MNLPTNTLYAVSLERKLARLENWQRLRRRPGFIIGAVISLFWVVCAILGDKITPHDPLTYTTRPKLSPRSGHWFGTDKIGRDVFSRVLAGARDVLLVAPAAAVLGVILGTILGMIMGYRRGWIDLFLSRIVEALLSLPVILIGLLILTLADTSPFLGAITFHSRKVLVIYVVALLFTPIVARTVRSAVIGERELEYVTSAKLRGETGAFIMSREILPNIMGPIIVELTVRIGYAIFTVSTLSFLGVGIQRPSPDWGLAISDGRDLLRANVWWPVTFPALAIATLVIGVNLIADSIQSVYER
ncbi:MAG TPA: ABC transporter permease [Ilumatobacteraceae bacterium]|nr:ABC transporter permease [Ilumatobacteraceae bacterium]